MNFIFLRKKIKNYLEKLIPFKLKIKNPIPLNLNKAIFVFGITDFFYRKQRWQFLSEILSKKIPVFYIDSSFIPKVRLKKDIFYSIYNQKNNLRIVKLASDRNYFIYQEEPNQNGEKTIIQSIKKIITDYQIKKSIFILTHPFWHFLFKYFKNEKIIYDCLDDHEIFKENRKDISKIENYVINNSNFVVVTSSLLKEKINCIDSNKKVFVINNGVSEELVRIGKNFIENQRKKESNNKKKIAGYIGEINWWFDEEIFKNLLINFPDIDFYLIGKIHNAEIKKMSNKFNNLKLFDEVKHDNLIDFLKIFNVALIPFKVNKFTNAINPVKIYEYFAFGLPVFSSKIKELKNSNNLIYFYNKKNYLEVFNKALKEKDFNIKKERNNTAKKNTWEKISKKYFELINLY